MYGFKNGLAEQLGIPADNIHTISPFVGGAFGSRGSLTQRTAIVALAAKMVGRPVRLEASRRDGFTIATYRAETRHRVRLGANQDGKLPALIHEGWEISSRPDDYKVAGTDASTRLYACPNVGSNVTIVHADRNTPGFMRSPPETPYLFALESAMDELAYALEDGPGRTAPGQRHAGRADQGAAVYLACADAAASMPPPPRFGWSQPLARARLDARRRLADRLGLRDDDVPDPDGPGRGAGGARRRAGGPPRRSRPTRSARAIMTAIALTVAGGLGVPLDSIQVEVGDSRLPPAPVAGGSNSTASVCNVVAKACGEIRDRLAQAAVGAQGSRFAGADPAAFRMADGKLVAPDGSSEPLDEAIRRVGNGAIEVYAENNPHGVPPDAEQGLYKGKATLAGGAKLKDRVQFAFGAHFVEVRVHRLTREVRAPRVVSAFAAGRIVNPKTAKSQLMGGQIWGISAALHEATEIDRRAARYYNKDLAEYLIPVNADIETIETIFVPEEDHEVNPLGIKGLGELGNVGLNAAVANAVYHATGVRIRELPVRIEKILV